MCRHLFLSQAKGRWLGAPALQMSELSAVGRGGFSAVKEG